MWEWRRITELVKINSDIKKITNRSVSNSASGPEIKMRLNLSKAKLEIEEKKSRWVKIDKWNFNYLAMLAKVDRLEARLKYWLIKPRAGSRSKPVFHSIQKLRQFQDPYYPSGPSSSPKINLYKIRWLIRWNSFILYKLNYR